jgi:hypothetical protein
LDHQTGQPIVRLHVLPLDHRLRDDGQPSNGFLQLPIGRVPAASPAQHPEGQIQQSLIPSPCITGTGMVAGRYA